MINLYALTDSVTTLLIKIGTNDMGIKPMDPLLTRCFVNNIIAFALLKSNGIAVFKVSKLKELVLRSLIGGVGVIASTYSILYIPLAMFSAI